MAYPQAMDDVDLSMGTIPDGSGAVSQAINGMLTCTYNESHSVSGGRYFSHIEACRKVKLQKSVLISLNFVSNPV